MRDYTLSADLRDVIEEWISWHVDEVYDGCKLRVIPVFPDEILTKVEVEFDRGDGWSRRQKVPILACQSDGPDKDGAYTYTIGVEDDYQGGESESNP